MSVHTSPRRIWLAIALYGTWLPGLVEAQSPLVSPAEIATPLTIVAPEFPANSSAKPAGTRVEVVGTVIANGEFEPTSILADAGEEQFAEAVRNVLRWWKFVPAIDLKRCAPTAAPSRFEVWFEGSDSSSHGFFLSFPKVAATMQAIQYTSIDAPGITYPRKFIGIEGEVRVLYLVDPEGRVKSAIVRSSTPYGAFDEVVLAAARETTVTWKDPKPASDLCLERTHQFCMQWRRETKVEFDRCRDQR